MVNANFYNVELRDKSGNLRQYLTPFATDLSWEWNRIGGCGRASMTIHKEYREIEFAAGDDIQIRLRSGSTSKLVYRGWISKSIPSLKSDQHIGLDIRGYFDRLSSLVVHTDGDDRIYTNYVISDIVEDIVDTFITPNTDITKGTIDAAIFMANSLTFKATVGEALRTLAELEGKIEYGVDENLAFYWRAESETLRHKFFVGVDIEKLERRVDWDRLLNKIYFEGGEVSGSKYIKTAEAQDSQNNYFLAEGIISNSSITTSSVTDQYLSSILKERSSPQLVLKFSIPCTSLRLEDTLPLGAIAVYDSDYDESLYIVGEAGDGGSDLTVGLTSDGGSNATIGALFQDQIDRISYTLAETDEKVNVEITMGGSLLETAAKLKQIELMLSTLRQR